MIKQITTSTAEDSQTIAAVIGAKLRGGEVIELVSDLGGGKTTFTRGLAKGMGSASHVSSPTFMISRMYTVDKLTMHHFDFYRLPEAGLIEHELEEVLNDPSNVIVVEWSGVVQHVLPKDRLTIKFETKAGDQRQLTFDYPAKLAYVMESIQ